jgi:hypothetical protein
MTHWVLLELKDEATENFVKKAGSRVLGVWETPTEFCDCDHRSDFNHWYRDAEEQRPLCKTCKKVHKIYVIGIGYRTRWAFGRNLIGRFLPGRKDFD